MELREYQERTIEQIRNAIRQGNRKILACLPTGSGKSIIMAAITKGCVAKGNRVLALMHRRQLVEQLQERMRAYGVDSAVIMAGKDADLDHPVQIGTIQTYSRRVDDPSADDKIFGINWLVDAQVILLDECHRSLSKTFQGILAKYPDKTVIGFTATPSLSSGVGMGNYYDVLLQPTSVTELVKGGSLVNGLYYGLSAPDLAKVKIVAGDYEAKGLGEAVKSEKLIGDVVTNWLKIAAGKKTLMFAVNVKHSRALVNEFTRHEIPAAHLDAHSSDDERSATLAKFRAGGVQVLSNVGLYTEGTDIPEIECIVLARPTKSFGYYLQMVGRGARPAPGKDHFLVLDHGANVNEHGFYEDEIEWGLDGKKLACRKIDKPIREKKKFACEQCGCTFVGKQCPACLTEVKNYGKQIEAYEAELEAMRRKQDEGKEEKVVYTRADKERWYSMFMSEKLRLGKSNKWLLKQYQVKFGVWPRGMELCEPMDAGHDVRNWLSYQRIKWIKSKQAEERRNGTHVMPKVAPVVYVEPKPQFKPLPISELLSKIEPKQMELDL